MMHLLGNTQLTSQPLLLPQLSVISDAVSNNAALPFVSCSLLLLLLLLLLCYNIILLKLLLIELHMLPLCELLYLLAFSTSAA
jgi:hypothetical protein